MTEPTLLFETPRLRLQALAPGDEARLQEVFMAAGDYFLSITGQPRPEPDAAAREIAAATLPGRHVALLTLRESAEPVGALGWWEGNPEPDVALLGMLMVVPARRGQGVAREALSGLQPLLRERGVRRLRTAAGAGDTQRHALLLALGFAPMDERRHIPLDRGRIMIALFEKALD